MQIGRPLLTGAYFSATPEVLMSHYHIWTIGCQMNKADSDYLATHLEQLGYQAIPTIEQANLIVVNSCVVRQSAENRVIGKLYDLKRLKKLRENLVIVLTGCMVGANADELKHRFPHVDYFLRPQAIHTISEVVEIRAPAANREVSTPSPPSVTAFVPIIRGCNNFCSYCIVPYRRGREKSQPQSDILCQVQALVNRGVKEVTLLGQNVDSYGHDLPARPSLADLLAELNSIDGLLRIRFLTSHPKDMSQRIIQAVARLKRVCQHISLPVQAGDNAILKAMRRGYTVDQYRELIYQIRQTIPGVALSTDVIVGFPGETEDQFRTTVDLLHELRFDTVHVAAYSPRPGAIASRRFNNDVPLEVKKQRLQTIERLQAGIAAEINAQLRGKSVEVLVEGQKKGKWQGRTRTNKLVFFSHPQDCRGQLAGVRIEKTSPWSLQGKVENIS